MSEDHSPASPSGDAPGVTSDNAPPPMPANVHVHPVHHDDAPIQSPKEEDNHPRFKAPTPRPTFMEHLANSREAQFQLHRQDSSELEHYFVCDPQPLRANMPPGIL